MPRRSPPPVTGPVVATRDVSSLRFPLPSVAAIVVGAISIVGSQYVLVSSVTAKQAEQAVIVAQQSAEVRLDQARIQSDVRDILTRMEAQRIAAESALQQMSSTIADLNRKLELLRLQYEEMRRR